MIIHTNDWKFTSFIWHSWPLEEVCNISLHCAKLILPYFVNRQLPSDCIYLIEEWLENETERNRISVELNEKTLSLSRDFSRRDVVYAMGRACYVIICKDLVHARYAAYSTISHVKHITSFDYSPVCNSFASTTTLTNPIKMGRLIDKNDISSILALFDELLENDEDIIQIDGNFRLNLPVGYEIRGNTHLELAKSVINDNLALYFLKRLYGSVKAFIIDPGAS